MTLSQKRFVTYFRGSLIVANTCLFLGLAVAHRLSQAPEDAVFIDFWGRFTVYSMWFIGFVLYAKYLSDRPFLKWLVLGIVIFNIPLFLGLAYLQKISNAADILVFVDFWGRITVYSLWVLLYEAYKKYVGVPVTERA